MSEEQERAVKRVARALHNFRACGLVGFVGETGFLHVFVGRVPMSGLGGTVDTDKEVASFRTNLEAGAY